MLGNSLSIRSVNFLPKEPVPPVTNTDAFDKSNIKHRFQRILKHNFAAVRIHTYRINVSHIQHILTDCCGNSYRPVSKNRNHNSANGRHSNTLQTRESRIYVHLNYINDISNPSQTEAGHPDYLIIGIKPCNLEIIINRLNSRESTKDNLPLTTQTTFGYSSVSHHPVLRGEILMGKECIRIKNEHRCLVTGYHWKCRLVAVVCM